MEDFVKSGLGFVCFMGSATSFGYGYWNYLRKINAIGKATEIPNTESLTQIVPRKREVIEKFVGPRLFCKMSGTVGCKSPLTSATGLQVAIFDLLYKKRSWTKTATNFTRKKVPFSCDLPGGISIKVNDDGAELYLEKTTSGREFHESVLRCGGPIFLVGSVGMTEDGQMQVAKGMMKWMMITNLTEEEILKKFTFYWNLYKFGGIGLFALGGVFVFLRGK